LAGFLTITNFSLNQPWFLLWQLSKAIYDRMLLPPRPI